ncbi:protochlorophyllide-dependent translocon component 52, chloroplastic [Ricinus communis]|uniref:Pheophorbide A oxygenase, putative n=1 Tax=Ricinus communis TaxID=3988 RepID=B9T573_RICCO|nr:protochlorophyllide-dependent translocon component 52, chloroplastic [Ricinus communis]EEF28992.1 pheophorbide A oxygenase, putative [Ricinus communis]|eukprot:XP_002533392.1 protochlorophyllide-dependent translocon component 52, chloroplastic [Ricinus communis]
METIKTTCYIPPFHIPTSLTKTKFSKPNLNFHFNAVPTSSFSKTHKNASKSKLYSTISSSSSSSSSSSPPSAYSVSTESIEAPQPELETDIQGDKFDWYSAWYPVMPVCDLDKRVPHAKKVLGIDVVVWWDRNENEWRVFDDTCPHRLAPLSEGRIDQWGRLQCVYHGWCFNGSGDCKYIPQAPADGPPVHTFNKACVAAYPSTVHHDILWFWPNTDPQYKDILMKEKPPFIPELDDPSYTKTMGNRDIPYGYDFLIENLMDPAHVPYAHYGLMKIRQPKEKVDREGGKPIDMSVKKLDKNGFIGKQEKGSSKFIAPCIFYAYTDPLVDQGNGAVSSSETKKKLSVQQRAALVFICIPVSPGNSRLIWAFPRNFGVWIDKIFPRWMFHVGQNLILDSDLYLLHVEERKITDIGVANWQKACFVPTKSDALVVGFRKWLNNYAGGQVDWRGKYNGALPPTPPREQLMDRYWSHVVNCSSCNAAHKGLNALEVILQVVSLVLIGIVAAAKQSVLSAAARTTLVAVAVACFAASRWLAHFIYKSFHYHDYNHALR